MTILPPLTHEEYEALKRVVEEIDRVERKLGRPFRGHDLEAFRVTDEMRSQMRAAVEGYEVDHPPE